MEKKIISLKAVRELRQAKLSNPTYEAKILGMEKLDLLNEMVRFQEERAKEGELTLDMMIRGKILFKALEETAETEALRSLTRSYRRHLHYELEARLNQSSNGHANS